MLRHPPRRPRPHPLALEALEDRLLLSVLAMSPSPDPSTSSRAAPAPTTPYVESSTDGDATPGDVGPTPADAAAAPAVAKEPAQSAASRVAAPGALSGVASPSPTGSANAGADGTDSSDSAAEYPPGTSADRYAAQSGNEYYPPASPSSQAAARTSNSGTTAVLGVSAPAAVATAALFTAAAVSPAPDAAPVPSAAPGRQAAAAPAEPIRLDAAEAVAAAWEGFRSADETASTPKDEEELTPSPAEVEAARLFPLALPLPGGLVVGELQAWERAVRTVFSRLDALARDPSAESLWSWGRLAPWCAALGVATVALEVARRQLGKRPAAAQADSAGRGLAWRWPQRPEEAPDQP